MSTFSIDEEIDKLVNKFSEDLKSKLKKIVVKSEKLILKEYIQKEKEKMKNTTTVKKQTKNVKKPVKKSANNLAYDDSYCSSDEN